MEKARPAWELEVEARAVNATDWQPMSGMVKRQCDWCCYFFAAPATSHEPRCPDCVGLSGPPRVKSNDGRRANVIWLAVPAGTGQDGVGQATHHGMKRG
jgi:hypothetical protein